MKILISCPQGKIFDMFFDDENIEIAEQLGQVIWNMSDENMTEADVKRAIKNCDVYVTYWGSPRVDAKLLREADNLKAVIHLGGTLAEIVSEEVFERGICVLCAEELYTASAAEGILTYMLSAMRRIPEYSVRVKCKKDFIHSWDTHSGIVGKTVGIVNYGKVSERLTELLAPFDVEILVYDKMGITPSRLREGRVETASLDELCKRSNIVVVNTASYPDSYNMLNADSMQYMKKGALLVDTSIGGVVNKNDLLTLLLNGRISAVLDMCEQDMDREGRLLMLLNNLTLMPRIAGPATDIYRIAAKQLLRECADFINRGKVPRHSVSPSRRERRTF